MAPATEMLAPAIALVLWTAVIWAWMYATRIPAIVRARMELDPMAPRGEQMATLLGYEGKHLAQMVYDLESGLVGFLPALSGPGQAAVGAAPAAEAPAPAPVPPAAGGGHAAAHH